MNKEKSPRQRTSLPNEQEEPHTASEVQQQRDSIPRIPQQIDDGEESAVQLALDPAVLDRRRVQNGVSRRAMCPGSSTNEGGCKAPGQADEDEGEDIVGHGGLLLLDSAHDWQVLGMDGT